MHSTLTARRVLAACALSVIFTQRALAQADVPSSPASGWVTDAAQVCSPAEIEALVSLVSRVQESEGVRLAVLTLKSSRGEDPKAISVRTLNSWRAGRRSVLLLLVLEPRKLYIQPGEDLALRFDETSSSAICRDVIAPRLRSGDRGAALLAGLEAIRGRLQASSPSPSQSSVATPTAPAPSFDPSSAAPSFDPSFARSSSTNPLVPIFVGVVVVGLVFFLACFALGKNPLTVFSRKCYRCRTPMKSWSRRVVEPGWFTAGQGETTYNCPSCGFSYVEPYTISSSSYGYGSSGWGSGSSCSSGSSSSSFDSGSSSSSSGSGGGGSDW